MTTITFSSTINQKAFLRLALQVMLLSRFIKVFYAIGILAIFLFVVNYGFSNGLISFFVFTISIFLFIYPIIVFLIANRNYKSSPAAKAPVLWTIDDNGIELTGLNYVSKFSWNGILKITENKAWIFIWYTKSKFAFFQRNLVTSAELNELKLAFYNNRKRSNHPIFTVSSAKAPTGE